MASFLYTPSAALPLQPQWHIYAEREAAGFIVCATLREGAKLIGYKVGFVAPGLHYESPA